MAPFAFSGGAPRRSASAWRAGLTLVSLALGACGVGPPVARTPAAAAPVLGRPLLGRVTYEATYEPAAQVLSVEARYPPGTPGELALEAGSEPWLRDVQSLPQGPAPALAVRGGRVITACADGCAVRYRYALGASGRERQDIDTARTDGPFVIAPPSTWLLAPVGGPDEAELELTVHVPEGHAFVSGLAPDPARGGARTTTLGALRRAPYSAFGPFDVVPIDAEDTRFTLAIPARGRRPAPELLVAWVRRSAAAVRAALGRFPARHAALIVALEPGDDVEVGFSLAGSSIVLRVGVDTGAAALERDWVLTHEMLHFACPSQPETRTWAEEGLATYVEPFARARAGLLSREAAWAGLVRGFHFGQPQAGDAGLDHTPTWGRIYWGGALFYFEADYAIRVRTEGRKTLFDALAAIVRAGGTNASGWSLERAFAVGDAATGVPVLTELLEAHGAHALRFEYPAHLADLGVHRSARGIELDPRAPRAHLTERW